MALLAFAFFVAASSGGSWGLVTAASVLVALFLQQSGWLCHDLLHHQVMGHSTNLQRARLSR